MSKKEKIYALKSYALLKQARAIFGDYSPSKLKL